MVYRQKVYSFTVHPILVRHPNHTVLECDQVGDPARGRERLPELGRRRRRAAIHYDYCRWSLHRWIHHGHIPLAASAGRQHAARKTTYKPSHKTPFSMGLVLLRSALRRISGPSSTEDDDSLLRPRHNQRCNPFLKSRGRRERAGIITRYARAFTAQPGGDQEGKCAIRTILKRTGKSTNLSA